MNMRRQAFSFILIMLGIAGGALIHAWADERAQKPLPEWVMKLVGKQFPEAEFVRGHREGDDDEQRYEVKLRQRNDGRNVSIDLTPEEGVVEIDEQLNRDQVPERVMKALRRAFPKADIKEAEKNIDMRTSYTLLVTSEGRKREVTISARGKILEIEKRD